ncbi:MAG: DNA replication/repair protein RecF [Clostridia bacterium]|nr:DNA replication/repair protein RecF [Clostridia bacterium]
MRNFRNYHEQTVCFGDRINLVLGDNAQGKTNLLEGVFVLCVGKSLRARDKDLIRQGESQAVLEFVARKRSGKSVTKMVISGRDNKRISVNGLPLKRTGELLGTVAAISFHPEDLKIVKDAPDSRRRFLDVDLSQAYKGYYAALGRYQKILLSRNNLLKRYDAAVLKDLLYPYDVQLAREGSILIRYRREYVQRLGVAAAKLHRMLTDGREELSVTYQSTLKAEEQLEQAFTEALASCYEKDLTLKYTTVGPHRDDIKLAVGEMDIRVLGSQGQQRTAALSLKLAELELFREIYGEYPILLLDDVLSELDASRQRRLLEICASVQSVVTATHIDEALLEGLPVTKIYVKGGTCEV